MSTISDYEQGLMDQQSGRELDAHAEQLKRWLEAGCCPKCRKPYVLQINPKNITFKCALSGSCGWFAIYPIAVISNGTLQAENDVEAALADLREMFPNHCVNLTWGEGIAAGRQVTIHLINPEANGTAWGDKRFSQPTLSKAMAAAREYYDDGREADIDARRAAQGNN